MAELIGKTLKGRYRVVESLGRGGMADVYKVWDEERAVYLAMKILRQDLAQDPIFLRRFQREAKALASLQHPHIVRFYGLERDDLLAFLLMEYVDGISLQAEILRSEGKALPMEHIQEVMEAVCSALHYAHHQGLVHCDIKPGNILIDKHGQIYLTDFGIARGMDAATSTMVGIGTPAYMAPELIRGEDPTPQTDIYALGIVLYEMLTGGERPFTGERATITGTTAEKVRWEHMRLSPRKPSDYNPRISRRIEKAILTCLEKEREERFLSIMDLFKVMEGDISEIEERLSRVTSGEHSLEEKVEKKSQKLSMGLVLGIVLLGMVVLLYSSGVFAQGAVYIDNADPIVVSEESLESIPNSSKMVVPTLIITNTQTHKPTVTSFPTKTTAYETYSLINLYFYQVSVRIGPGNNYPVDHYLRLDDKLSIIGRDNSGNWLYIEERDRYGWIYWENFHRELLKKDSNYLSNLEIILEIPPVPTSKPCINTYRPSTSPY